MKLAIEKILEFDEKTREKIIRFMNGESDIKLCPDEYMDKQLKEVFGPYNKYMAGIELNHDPTLEECLAHFYNHEGPEAYAKKNGHK